MATEWPVWVLGLIGSGAAGAWGRDIIAKIVPNREAAAEREANRINTQQENLDTSQKEFQASIYREMDKFQKMHEKCEDDRKKDNDKYQAALQIASEKIANLSGRVEFLQAALDNLKPGAPQSNGKATSRKKTKAC